MVTLRQIRSFVAVYEEASFTTAASREGATQSGLSQHVKQLEAALGTALLARDGREVSPTPAGRRYYSQCVEILHRLDAARQSIALDRVLGSVRVGLMPTFTRSVLSPALAEFLEQAPGCDIRITEAYSGVLTEMVLQGELDFAVVPSFEGAAGISHQLLARDREMLVSARSESSHHLTPVRLANLDPLKIIVPGPGNTRRRNIDTYLTSNGIAVSARLELDAMMGTLQLIAASDWVAILPFLMMVADLDEGRFSICPLDDPPLHSEFILIQPARRVLTPAAALFADVLRGETNKAKRVLHIRGGGGGA